jgi:hypothetical protein
MSHPLQPVAASVLRALSVVVPVAPGEPALGGLLAQLEALPDGVEVLLVGAEARPAGVPPRFDWRVAPHGRAAQLNEGGRAARGDVLWFLHADSRLTPGTLPALGRSLAADPEALHYFDLRFLDDGPPLMRINEAGVWLRSHLGGMPFGDQGLCLRREHWERLGGFPTDTEYGEDHLFVWRARRAGVRLRPTGGTLLTSARRYRERGWLATTTRHLRLTARQAFLEWLALVRR